MQFGKLVSWIKEHPRASAIAGLALAALVLLLGFASCAHAADANLNWDTPTKRTDGQALPLSEIARFEVAYGLCLAGGTLPASTTIANFPASAVTGAIPSLAPGQWCFAIRTVDTKGVQGPLTPAVAVTFDQAPPMPPGNFKVTKSALAYELRGYSNGTFRFVQIGTLPIGEKCGPDLAGGYALYSGAVAINKPTTPGSVIAARCG